MRKQRIRPLLGIAVALLLLLATSCQWLQNEFFFLDTARPEPPPPPLPGLVQPW